MFRYQNFQILAMFGQFSKIEKTRLNSGNGLNNEKPDRNPGEGIWA
jgi:hypothetical protein